MGSKGKMKSRRMSYYRDQGQQGQINNAGREERASAKNRQWSW